MTPQEKQPKKNTSCTLSKLKNDKLQRTLSRKWKDNLQDGRKYLKSNEGLVFKILYKISYNSTIKRQPNLKMDKVE